MLEVQKYLWENGLEKLVEEYSIQVVRHPTNKLIILNYHQIDSKPRDHPIVRECRGLVLEDESFILVGRSFSRFFNLGEFANKQSEFNWDHFNTYEKVDGSLISLFNYLGDWYVNTRASFGHGCVGDSNQSWRELFFNVFSPSQLALLDKNSTYVFELVGPHNKVVRDYPKTDLYLLSVFSYEAEMASLYVDKIADNIGIKRPQKFLFVDIESLRQFLEVLSIEDPTFEGCVLCDNKYNRIKCKNRSYLHYHRLKNNGSVFLLKNLVPLLLKGEQPELLAVFSEQADLINSTQAKLEKSFADLQNRHNEVKSIESQKEFALAIMDHPLKSIMFAARSNNLDIKDVFAQSEKCILNKVFGEK